MAKHQKPNGTISLFEAAKLTGYHQDYLGQLCRAGKIAAIKVGRNWYTTEQAMRTYFQLDEAEPSSDTVDEETALSPQFEFAEVAGPPIALTMDDEIAPATPALDARSRKKFRQVHSHTALAVAMGAIIGLLLAGGLLAYSHQLLGEPLKTAIVNYDGNPSLFKDKSVAGAVDVPVIHIIPVQQPTLLPQN